MKRTWKIKPILDSVIQQFGANAGLSPLLSRLLALRGIETPEHAKAFLSPAEQEIPNPYLFREMQGAVDRIQQAIERRERVLIHGDYDVDGVTGTCILLETLREFGLDPDYFLPGRMDAGYGIQVETIREKAGDYDLLVTVDCGMGAMEAIRAANDAGMNAIVTDHHNAGDERPPALAVINPVWPGETYPCKHLSGAGVAWKLASAIYERFSRFSGAERYLDLAALGTVADVVPLLGENRTLLARALEMFHRAERPGLQALMELSKVIPTQIGPQDIGFRLGPRLNAAGRMDDPRLALELLLTNDEAKAMELARLLHQLNAQRQSVETKILKEACDRVAQDRLLERSTGVLLVIGEKWHRGVLGIVAARLVQLYQRSVFLLSREEEIAIGSARSLEGVNLIPLLDAIRPHSISCGGHAGAGGLKILPDHLSSMERALYNAADEIAAPAEPSPLWLDAAVPLEQIDAAFMSELKRLEPYGEGNEEPLFYGKAAINGMGPRIVGNNHLRLTLRHPRGTIAAIGFGLGDKLETLSSGEVEMAFCCRWNEYQGRRDIDLHLRDIRPAQATAISVTAPKPPRTGFAWDRASLGKVYKLLEKSCSKEKMTPLQDVYLLAQLEKVTRLDFDKVVKIFSEIGLLVIRDGMIIIQDVKEKRNLTDSPTYRAILETLS